MGPGLDPGWTRVGLGLQTSNKIKVVLGRGPPDEASCEKKENPQKSSEKKSMYIFWGGHGSEKPCSLRPPTGPTLGSFLGLWVGPHFGYENDRKFDRKYMHEFLHEFLQGFFLAIYLVNMS